MAEGSCGERVGCRPEYENIAGLLFFGQLPGVLLDPAIIICHMIDHRLKIPTQSSPIKNALQYQKLCQYEPVS